jgi:negative regulator of flagellin synthesis FlgM
MRMDIRNSLDGLKSLFGVESTGQVATRPTHYIRPDETAIESDRATVSSAGSEVSQAAHQDGVRMEKLASIQAAIAAGNYDVPAAAVATKVIDALLGGQK